MIAILIRRVAVRAGAANEPIGKEGFLNRVVRLLDVALRDQSGIDDARPDLRAQRTIFFGVRTTVVVEGNVKVGKVALMLSVHRGNELFLTHAGSLGGNHDGRAVRVVRAEVDALVASELLESHPNVGLQVLHQVANVNGAVGVGQGRGNQEATHGSESRREGLGARK